MKYETIFGHLQAVLTEAARAGMDSRQIFARAAARAQELMQDLGGNDGMHGTRGLRPNIPFRIDVRGLLADRFLRVTLQHRDGEAWETRALAFLDARNKVPPLYTSRGRLCGGTPHVTRPVAIRSRLPQEVRRMREVANRQARDWEREFRLVA